jgi:hypothetical protein
MDQRGMASKRRPTGKRVFFRGYSAGVMSAVTSSIIPVRALRSSKRRPGALHHRRRIQSGLRCCSGCGSRHHGNRLFVSGQTKRCAGFD